MSQIVTIRTGPDVTHNGIKVQLFKNFRSRKNVLEFTNFIFENIMSKGLGDIDYTEEEYLNLGAQYEECKQDYLTEVNIINSDKKNRYRCHTRG